MVIKNSSLAARGESTFSASRASKKMRQLGHQVGALGFEVGAAYRVIATAAVEIGFSRRVSLARVGRELERYCPRAGKPELDPKDAPARFRAVGELFILMSAARDLDGEIAKLRRNISERAARVRKLAAKVAA